MSSNPQTLIDSSLTPTMVPDRAYRPAEGTVVWRRSTDGKIVLEGFTRSNTLFGFRYQAWVAWRDAAGEVQSHSWWETHPDRALVTDNLERARAIAEQHAASHFIELGPQWTSVV